MSANFLQLDQRRRRIFHILGNIHNLFLHDQCAVSVYCRQHAQRYASKEDVGDLELDR